MKQIKLKSLKLTHFKGIKDLEIEFTDNTFIKGANGSGKTTIFDAFTWLLFGKNSYGQTDFEIKTLDKNGAAIPKIDHEVEAVIEVDGHETTIRRVYSEKWVKQRGAEEAVMTGHETSYYWDGVPLKQIDFKKNVAEICDEYVFKLITSPTAFNSLNWTERRDMLMKMVGDVHDIDVAGENPAYLELVQKLSKYKSEDDYKKMLQASIKKSKDEIKMIPSRIDEVQRGKPEMQNTGLELQNLINIQERKMNHINEQINDKMAAVAAVNDAIVLNTKEKYRLQGIIDNIEFDAKREAKKRNQKDDSKLRQLESERDGLVDKRSSLQFKIRTSEVSHLPKLNQELQYSKTFIEEQRKIWAGVNAEQFDEHKKSCPTCSQVLPDDKVAELVDNFNSSKRVRLGNISQAGKSEAANLQRLEQDLVAETEKLEGYKKELELINTNIEELSNRIVKEQNALDNLTVRPESEIVSEILTANEQYKQHLEALKMVTGSIPETPTVDYGDLKERKEELQSEIEGLKRELLKEQQIAAADKRIAELEKREKELAQEIAGVEKQIFLVEQFTKAKVEEIESRVQHLFKHVSFRLFREQINGGLEPCCDTLINGVPFNDANTASKINGGVDIINTLTNNFGITAPIWIDNRESVTDIIETGSQLISLIVSPAHKKLTIEAAELKFVNN